MADKKISQLTAATTPLAGTEVLPIVQSSSTKKVATDDLTVKNVRSNATTGILQVAGPAAGTTRVMTTPDANFTAARTDAANSFTGDQTLSTGNLIQGTAAKGFNFSANTGAAGKTSSLLNWYEEGTWTPELAFSTSGSVSYSSRTAYYTKVGNVVTVNAWIAGSTVSSPTGDTSITGFPFAIKDGGSRPSAFLMCNALTANGGITGQVVGYMASSTMFLYTLNNGTTATLNGNRLNTSFELYLSFSYIAA